MRCGKHHFSALQTYVGYSFLAKSSRHRVAPIFCGELFGVINRGASALSRPQQDIQCGLLLLGASYGRLRQGRRKDGWELWTDWIEYESHSASDAFAIDISHAKAR